MYYVYVLKSILHESFYIGMTKDLRRRFMEHNRGDSAFTRKYCPFKIIYYEASESLKDALAREIYLKSGMGRRYLKNRLKFSGDMDPVRKAKHLPI